MSGTSCSYKISGKQIRLILLVWLLICTSSTVAFTNTTELVSHDQVHSFLAMDTFIELRLFGTNFENQNNFSNITSKIEEIFKNFEDRFSFTKSRSEISRLNQNLQLDNQEPIEVSEKLAQILKLCQQLYLSSDGIFDVSCAPIIQAYGFYDRNFRIPGSSELSSLLNKVGIYKLEIIDNQIRVFTSGLMIDLGGVVKKLALFEAAEYLKNEMSNSNGFHGFVLNAGGDVAVRGSKDGVGMPFRIGVNHPRQPGQIAAVYILNNGFIITSGDYERFFEIDGKRFSHIISPQTGRSDVYHPSVSLASNQYHPMLILATSLVITPTDKAKMIIHREGDQRIHALMIDQDHSIIEITTEGFQGMTEIKYSSKDYGVYIILALLILSSSLIIYRSSSEDSNSRAYIFRGSDLILELDLTRDSIGEVTGTLGPVNYEIKSKRIRITNSPCSDKICVKTGWISDKNPVCICVPSGITLTVNPTFKDHQLDTIAY